MEITTKYVQIVDSLDAAWTFVLQYTEGVKGTPRISIGPLWDYSESPNGTLKFEACVSIHQRLADAD